MDPNAKLERIRELLDTAGETDPLELRDAIWELDEWLSRGGSPPDAWVKNAHYNHPASIYDSLTHD